MKISDMSDLERPREKMLEKGAESLSDGELIAVLIGSGSRNESAVELGQKVMKLADGRLSRLAAMTVGAMAELPGMGKKKIASIKAAIEIGKRFSSENSWRGKEAFTSPRIVYEMMMPRLKGLNHEECWVVFLSGAQLLIAAERMTSGAMDFTVVDIKHIIKRTLDLNAALIVIVHNHPSGNPQPSRADIQSTERLKVAASAFDIGLLDHIIIADDLYYSFSDQEVYSA